MPYTQIAFIILFIIGALFYLRSLWLRKPDHPTITGKGTWKMGLTPWKFRSHWHSRGYMYYMAGMLFIFLGFLVNILYLMQI